MQRAIPTHCQGPQRPRPTIISNLTVTQELSSPRWLFGPYNPDKSLALSAGTRLGVYEITAPIGAGGMGEVYRARDPRLGRDVAIKVLPSAFSADIDRLHRFEQEARAAAALNHPNILAVYDIGTDGGAPFIVSELLEGETLRERARGGPVAVRKATEYALQIARGLTAAHEKGITHRDLKPENVFVTRDNRVKILDFGLAKLTQDQPALATLSAAATVPSPTHPGVVLGTVGYMAPEQVRGVPVDQRADLFAFGAILYELLSGVRAFPASRFLRQWRQSSILIRRISARLRPLSRQGWSGLSVAASRRIRRTDFRRPAISLSLWTTSRTRRACRQPHPP